MTHVGYEIDWITSSYLEACNPFLLELAFEKCILNYSSFYQLNLKEVLFNQCKLENVDFTETNLTKAKLMECDLTGAVFSNSNLTKADLRTVVNLSLDPEKNTLTESVFSKESAMGLLTKYRIKIKD